MVTDKPRIVLLPFNEGMLCVDELLLFEAAKSTACEATWLTRSRAADSTDEEVEDEPDFGAEELLRPDEEEAAFSGRDDDTFLPTSC